MRPNRADFRAAILLGFAAVLVAVSETGWSAEPVAESAQPFLVKDCTGPAAGKTLCYYCRYGNRPVVGVFVREWNADVTRLIEQLDRLVGEHRDERLAAFVVLLADDTPAAERELKQLAEKSGLRHTPLTIFRDEPEILRDTYRIADAAPATILMWQQSIITVRQSAKKLEAAPFAGWLAEIEKRLQR